MVAVSDQEILEAMTMTARLGGVFGEPAAVAAVAGLRKAREQNVVSRTESALIVITGNGLKDIESAKRATGPAIDIQPHLDDVANHLSIG
jgi:threonine synthase